MKRFIGKIVLALLLAPAVHAQTYLSDEEVNIQTGTTAAITVNASADWVVILGSHYDGNTNTGLASAGIDGENFTIAAQVNEGENEDANGLFAAFLYGPSTGSQTLTIAWTGGGDRSNGGDILVIYGEDTNGNATEVRDAAAAHASSGDQSVAVDTETTDVLFGLTSAWDANTTIDTANSTLISSDPMEGPTASIFSRGYDITPVATSTSVDQNINNFGGVIGISLRESAGGGQSPVPIILQQH